MYGVQGCRENAVASMDHPKFIQIMGSNWRSSKDSSATLNHTLYALSEDGEVYRFMLKDGWKVLEGFKGKDYDPNF
jgi:hypothetical protein